MERKKNCVKIGLFFVVLDVGRVVGEGVAGVGVVVGVVAAAAVVGVAVVAGVAAVEEGVVGEVEVEDVGAVNPALHLVPYYLQFDCDLTRVLIPPPPTWRDRSSLILRITRTNTWTWFHADLLVPQKLFGKSW